MEFIEVVKKRHSVRNFENTPVEDEKIDEIISAGLQAPSAGNVKDYRIVVVKNEKIKKSLKEAAYNQNHIVLAPVVLVVYSDLDEIFLKYNQKGIDCYSLEDSAAMTENILLAATNTGLGSCWVGGFDEKKVKEALDLNGHKKPIVLIPIGYEKGNKAINENINIEKFVIYK